MSTSAFEDATIRPEDYKKLCKLLEEACGIVLGDNKHYLVNSRLKRLLKEFSLPDLGKLVDGLVNGGIPKLRESVIDAMTTNETSWFRDGYPYDFLMDVLFPELAENRTRNIRIWSAACSSGQEPYSISMKIQEFQASRPGSLSDVQVLSTDLSPSMLSGAQQGTYDNLPMSRGLSEELRARHFIKKENYWEVKKEIRNRVSFKELNLMKGYAALGKFNVIFIRNVLIYFSSEVKLDILTRMSEALKPGGYLILGGSESMGSTSKKFEAARFKTGLVYRIK